MLIVLTVILESDHNFSVDILKTREIKANYEVTVWHTERKKWSQFDLKNWVTGGTKIRLGIPSNWRRFKPNNQQKMDSQYRVKTRYWESICVTYSPITGNLESNFS